ncbi:phage distal tail protein [Catenuloplanes sp. NPDC051500]|uniref:phage distal tail protein n=1 Tax=Catenuloplanes sp. NPDC051500 TaxID=3363959 RepID=UPI0037A17D16
MPHLQLESSTDVLNLDDVLNFGTGIQALAGATGLGFPEVVPQWSEGAGDGATFRGSRLGPRDIDLPLHINTKGRQQLKDELARLEIMLAEGGMTLRMVEDDGTSWSVPVEWQGGGAWIYGVDTIGETDLSTVVTLRAGSPYWTSSVSSSTTVRNSGAGRGLLNGSLTALKVAASQAIGTIHLVNPGSAPSPPIWTVTGPGTNFTATSPTGETLRWTGTLTAGQVLTVDASRASVVDQSGANRYANLAPAPRFWHIPRGTSDAVASMDNTTTASSITCTWRARKRVII